jgi:hypothetical protein
MFHKISLRNYKLYNPDKSPKQYMYMYVYIYIYIYIYIY